MEIAPLDSQEELAILRALVAEQAVKLNEREAEVGKRDDIIKLLKAQLDLRRHSQHGASSEKIDRKIEQYELMLEEIESARAEAAARVGKDPLPELDDGKGKPKRKPLPENLLTEELIYAAPCSCPTCGGSSFLKAADKIVEVMEHVPESVKIVRHVEKRMICKDCDTMVAGESSEASPGRACWHTLWSPSSTITSHYIVSRRCMIGWE
jgi:transposase